MPLLPIPVGGTNIAGGDLPVSDAEDVIKEFPKPHRRPAVAPVRDAFCEGWAEGFITYQDAAAYAAAQSDLLRATGDYLKSFSDEHSIVPLPGESEASVRARMFVAPNIVTVGVIIDGINAIIASLTCTMSELELDGVFINDGTSSAWDSFVGTNPNYDDRYYADIPERIPGGYIPSRGYPRSFFIRIPTGPSDDQLARVVAFVESVKGQGISWSLVVGSG